MDSLTKECGVLFLKVGKDGIVRVKQEKHNGAMNGGGGEFSTEPAWLANPGDAFTDWVEEKLCTEISFQGWVAIGIINDWDAVHGNAGVALL